MLLDQLPGFLLGFVAGTMFFAYLQVQQDRQRARREYEQLSNDEKLVRQIEDNMDPKSIASLLEVANVTYQRPSDGVTPIIATVRYKGKLDKNHQNRRRRMRSLVEIVKRLGPERTKAAVNVQDHRGYTALMYAAEQSDDLCVSLLLHYGADKAAKNDQGETAAMIAHRWPTTVGLIERGERQEILVDLVLKYANPSGRWP